MKVMITDDEIQIRKGLRMKIAWEDEGFQIVAEASDGQEALDLLKTNEIDLVITDIKMPIMNGIDFAKVCHREFPKVKILALSGYSDYEYLRSAMKEGIKDYLLKPVAPDELVDALRKIRSDIEKDKNKQRKENQIQRLAYNQMLEMQEQYLLYLVKEEWSDKNLSLEKLQQVHLSELGNVEGEFQFITVEMRNSDNHSRLDELWLPFQMLCREIAKEHGAYCFYDPSYKHMIHFVQNVKDGTFLSNRSLGLKVQKYTKSFLKLETVIGIGKIVKGIAEFKKGYKSSLLSWSQSQLGTQSQIVDQVIYQEMFEYSPELERKLLNGIETGNELVCKQTIQCLIEGKPNYSVMSFSFVSNRVLLFLETLSRKFGVHTMDLQKNIWDCQQSIWELNAQNKVIEQLIQLAKTIITHVQKARYSNGTITVESVRRYLDQHYASDISLASVSEQFHINGAYLSEIFKNHVGQTFSDYLISMRMKNAQRLLKDNQLKIIDVAYLVGFSNSGYFSTAFKKHFGLTPAEFRKSASENYNSPIDEVLRA
ncbi:response regulator [Bacillus sp. 03113]|uniref:response regulator transcription factor n=1 Tax=Bacillus sp. 03113 TaxID=2578211 RepID=UPI001141F6B5|nr:response regulator [Bacillus sp. 03113]